MAKREKRNYRTIIDIAVLAGIVILARMFLERLLPLFYERFGLYFSDFLFQTLSNYPLTIAMVVGDFALITFLFRKMPYGSLSMVRTAIELVGVILISILSALLLRTYQINKTDEGALFFDKLFWFIFVTDLIFNVVIVMILDIIFYYRWSHKKALAEEVEKRSAANYQYQLLKSQLNPHFLFNSLNVLDYLIQTDPEKASDYVKRLASIYRYLLKIESQPIVMLEEEVAFVKQYVNLLLERFGAALSFDLEIPEDSLNKKIVPCGMQMLIENAVKHNVANTSHVLRIEAFVEGDTLVVRNNMQPKMKASTNTGIGLNSIKKQYQILFNKEVVLSEDGKMFEVRIPLVD